MDYQIVCLSITSNIIGVRQYLEHSSLCQHSNGRTSIPVRGVQWNRQSRHRTSDYIWLWEKWSSLCLTGKISHDEIQF